MMEYVVGDHTTVSRAASLMPLPAFSDEVCEFLSSFATEILSKRDQLNADVATVAFFSRRANLEKMRRRYPEGEIRVGRGRT